MADEIEGFFERGVTDGLPVVPPTRTRVDAMLAAAPRDRHHVVAEVPPNMGRATVEKIWRRRVLENHPDRFMHDPAEQGRASERLRHLNEAHDVLDRELGRRERG